MTLDEAREHIGHGVRYAGQSSAKATSPEDLELLRV